MEGTVKEERITINKEQYENMKKACKMSLYVLEQHVLTVREKHQGQPSANFRVQAKRLLRTIRATIPEWYQEYIAEQTKIELTKANDINKQG